MDASIAPARAAGWVWSVRRFARTALWALPASAVALGWTALGEGARPAPLSVWLAGLWLGLVAQVALTALLAGTRARRSALVGLLAALAGVVMLPVAALAPDAVLAGVPIQARDLPLAVAVATGVYGLGWLLTGWAVFRSGLLNPADGVLLMLSAVALGAGSYAVDPLPMVGALLMLAAGMGAAVTGGRLLPTA